MTTPSRATRRNITVTPRAAIPATGRLDASDTLRTSSCCRFTDGPCGKDSLLRRCWSEWSAHPASSQHAHGRGLGPRWRKRHHDVRSQIISQVPPPARVWRGHPVEYISQDVVPNVVDLSQAARSSLWRCQSDGDVPTAKSSRSPRQHHSQRRAPSLVRAAGSNWRWLSVGPLLGARLGFDEASGHDGDRFVDECRNAHHRGGARARRVGWRCLQRHSDW